MDKSVCPFGRSLGGGEELAIAQNFMYHVINPRLHCSASLARESDLIDAPSRGYCLLVAFIFV